MATTRLTRDERKEQTREELVDAARDVFARRGFHRASLEEIASEAGYTKGAIYSNFKGKDELFLAVLDDHVRRRLPVYVEVPLNLPTFEESIRAVGRYMWRGAEEEPQWVPLLAEFWTHASGRAPLRLQVLERHERVLAANAAVLDELARRHGLRYRMPSREIVRGAGALGRGMALERLLDPESDRSDVFETMFLAYALGLTEVGAATDERNRP